MATAKKTQIVITANAAVAKKVMDELQQRIDGIKQKMASLDVTTKQGQREFKKLEKELVSYNSATVQNITNTERISKAMKNLSGTSLNELKRALSAAKSELGKMSEGDKGLKQMQGNVKALQGQIDKLTGSVHKQGGAWQTAMKNLTAYVGLFQVFNKVKDVVTGAIKKNFEYSGSLTDIRKVSGLTMQDVNKLSEELAKIDTRTSVDVLAQLAYQGAKLGMGKYGVDGMKQFVAAADQINVAIGEEMGEDALPALSKIVETMGLIPKMGIEKAMLATGSAMFKLSSTSTATSSNIVEFVKRLTGVSRTAGITTDQLLALGSASDSLFLMPEVSATAMSKFIVALQKNHNLIEKDLGIQQGTIKNMYAAGNAMDAIVLVLEKMRDKGNMNALGSIFKDIDSDGQRLVTTMVTMSKNVDVLKDHLYESQEAFEEATAVTSEYEMQQQSAIGILERANNLWEKAFVNPEGVDSVKSLAQAWYDVSEMMTQSPIFKGSLKFALDALILSAKTLAALLPVFISFAASQGLWSLLLFLNNLRKAIWAAVTAQTALNTACKVNPYVALASIVLTVVGTIYSFATSAREAAKAEEEAQRKANVWKNKLGEAEQQADTLIKKMYSYKTALEKLNISQEERNRMISKFNRDFRPYINKLGIEIKSVSDLKKHYSELAQEIQQASYYRMREQAKEEALPAYQKDRLNAAQRVRRALGVHSVARQLNGKINVQESADPGEDDVWNTQLIFSAFSRGSSANDIYKQIIESRYKNVKSINVDKKTGRYSYTDKNGKSFSDMGDQGLLSALRHYQNATARELAKTKEIDEFFPISPDYTPWEEENPGTLENDAPDKNAIRAAKQEKREREKAWRDKLKQSQDQAKAIMDDVDNYYDRQINARMEQSISLGMDKTEQEQFLEPLRKNKLYARSQVRRAVAGKDNKFEDVKKMMSADMVEQPDAETGVNLSQGLLDNIVNNDIGKLRDLMEQLGKNLGLSMNSITAEIFAKATRSEQESLKLQFKQMEARRKISQEHDYTGVVQQNLYDDFNEMGYANPTKEETTITKKIVDGKEVLDTSAFDKRRKAIKDMFETARKGIAQLYTIDVSTSGGKGMLMKMLFGDDPDGMAERIKETLKDNDADWQSFYLKLIQYSDDYTEAEKKQYDDAKKITDQMWATNKRNLAQQERIRKIQQESNLFGKRTNILSNLGLADLAVDPEVELMRARMQAAEDYYEFVFANSRNQQLIDEAEHARQEAELNYANQMATAMKSRLSQMKELVQPIEDFGAAVGQALADMKNDADSANEAIKNALKSMLESWGKMALNDVNTQMWKAINDAGAKRAKAKAQPDIDAARANAQANVSDFAGIDWRNMGTEANPLWVRWSGDHYEDKSGNAVYTREDGTPLSTPDGANAQQQPSEPPAAWQKRNPGKTIDDYNAEVQAVAGQTGAAVADVATGKSSFADAGASVLAAGANAVLNAPIGGGKSKESEEKSKQLKEEKKHQKELSKEVEKGSREREKENKQGVENITKDAKEAGKEQTKLEEVKQNTTNAIVETGLNTTFQKKQENDAAVVEQSKDTAQAENTFSIVGAIGKCFEFLGPIAGPIAAASVMAILTGLMQWGLNAAFGSKNKKSSLNTKNTKLVSGMLTYDAGNVQDLKPFVSDNGEVYWAEEQKNVPRTGVNLLTTPTATTINGHPSLVAENGPELVIGRETTQAMMMNNPQLLKALVNYDRNYSGRRAYDTGNIAETSPTVATGSSVSDEMVSYQANTNAALLKAVNTLLQRLEQPIEAKIDMYGRGKLYDSMTKANQFMRNK